MLAPEVLERICEDGRDCRACRRSLLRSAVPLANALPEGGIDIMELTLRTPAAIDAVRAVRAEVPQMMVVAGTILTVFEQVQRVSVCRRLPSALPPA